VAPGIIIVSSTKSSKWPPEFPGTTSSLRTLVAFRSETCNTAPAEYGGCRCLVWRVRRAGRKAANDRSGCSILSIIREREDISFMHGRTAKQIRCLGLGICERSSRIEVAFPDAACSQRLLGSARRCRKSLARVRASTAGFSTATTASTMTEASLSLDSIGAKLAPRIM
jgi:hypothetical protein